MAIVLVRGWSAMASGCYHIGGQTKILIMFLLNILILKMESTWIVQYNICVDNAAYRYFFFHPFHGKLCSSNGESLKNIDYIFIFLVYFYFEFKYPLVTSQMWMTTDNNSDSGFNQTFC